MYRPARCRGAAAIDPTTRRRLLASDGEDGRPPALVTLVGCTFMDIGATWLSWVCPVPGGVRELLLGHDSVSDYADSGAYLGATIGRYANRIANGRFTLDGRTHRLETNQGDHTLHGGPRGWHRRRWQVAELGQDFVSFEIHSPDGDQGFPGALTARVTYEVSEDSVRIRYEADCDARTPLNLTNHAYFNLAGEGTVLDHTLRVGAARVLPVDESGLPSGDPQPVEATPFDYRSSRRVDPALDHAFVLDASDQEPAASLSVADLTLEVATDKPALQVYAGAGLGGVPGVFGAHAGIALESQFLPDSPNQPHWPNCVFGPARPYRYETRFRVTPSSATG